jgi:hypothetical protein
VAKVLERRIKACEFIIGRAFDSTNPQVIV